MAAMELDHLDRSPPKAFDGYIVRKDLVRKFARQYPVPTYVCEFLLGRYCASIDEEEIQEGLADRRAAASGPGGPQRRGGTVQGPCPRNGHGEDHRHHLGPAGRQDRLPTWRHCPACN